MAFESNPLKVKVRDAAWKPFTDGADDLEVAEVEANEIGKWELMIRVKAADSSAPRYFKLKLSEQFVTRIDPITVLDAYRLTSIAPALSADWLYVDIEGTYHACPLTVVTLATKGKDIRDLRPLEAGMHGIEELIRVICGGLGKKTEATGIMRRLLDISKPYQHGFMWGYDRWPCDPIWVEPWHPDYDLGYADGGQCKEVLNVWD